jgi:hypothetical protein
MMLPIRVGKRMDENWVLCATLPGDINDDWWYGGWYVEIWRCWGKPVPVQLCQALIPQGLCWCSSLDLRHSLRNPWVAVILYTHTHTHIYTQIYLLNYLRTYLITPWSRVLLEKLTGSQLVKKFPVYIWGIYIYIYIYIHTHTYTGCPGRNVKNFWSVFLMLKYTHITQNTYIQSWTVTEIMAREMCGLLADPRTVPASWQSSACPSFSVVACYITRSLSTLHTFVVIRQYSTQISCTVSGWRQRSACMRNV